MSSASLQWACRTIQQIFANDFDCILRHAFIVTTTHVAPYVTRFGACRGFDPKRASALVQLWYILRVTAKTPAKLVCDIEKGKCFRVTSRSAVRKDTVAPTAYAYDCRTRMPVPGK